MTAQPQLTQVQPSRKPVCRPAAAEQEITPILRQIQQERGRRLFVFVADDVDDQTVRDVYKWRDELKDAGGKGELDVLMHSPGGELNACHRIARLFANRADAWEALVPSLASSGATLICLGSANIVMSELAQLGP